MLGEQIPFDKLSKIGREIGIPARYNNWTNGEPAAAGRPPKPAKKPGRVLIEIFQEIPFAQNEALVAVYELPPGVPLPPPVTVGNQSVESSSRIVACIEHPVHWSKVEGRAREQRYKLTRLFAVDIDQVTALGEGVLDPRAVKHLRPASNYREVPDNDARLIEDQVAPAQRPNVAAKSTPSAKSGAK